MSTTDSFHNYFFTSNLTQHTCPGFKTARCPPPKACASDLNTGFTYCCDARLPEKPNMGRVCWSIGRTCEKDGSTITCGDGQDTWCCLSKTEICTGNSNQKNNCWSNAHNTLADISTPVLNDTYLSLSSSKPSLSSWTFDPATLMVATQTSTVSSTASPSVDTATSNISQTPLPGPSRNLSGGAIGGIVVSAVAVIAAVVGVWIYFLKRRNRQRVMLSEGVFFKDDKGSKAELSSCSNLQELSSQTRPQELGTEYAVGGGVGGS